MPLLCHAGPDSPARAARVDAVTRLLVDCMPLRAGGGVQVATALLEQLAARDPLDWQAVLPAPMFAGLAESLRAAIVGRTTILPKAGLGDILRAGHRLRAIERDLVPDIVFTVFGPAYFPARAPHLVGFALPNLFYERDPALSDTTPRSRIVDAWRRRAFRRADHLVVETDVAAQRLGARLGIAPDRISVVGNSVNPSLASQPRAPLPAGLTILIPSTYYPHKNLEVVPAIARAIAEQAPGLDFRFDLTLPPSTTGWRAIAAEAERLAVEAHVATVGSLDFEALAEAYRQHRIVFLPSLREVSSAVYPEAFHFHRPLVAADMDFARELCGDAAAFVPPRDPMAIAAAMLGLHASPDRIAALTAAGTSRLAAAYPTPDEKFTQQIALVEKVAQAGRDKSAWPRLRHQSMRIGH